MTTSKHSPTPWHVIQDRGLSEFTIIDARDDEVAAWEDTPDNLSNYKEDAVRITRCVNACADIAYPERLGPLVAHLRRVVETRGATEGARNLASAILVNLDTGKTPGADDPIWDWFRDLFEVSP